MSERPAPGKRKIHYRSQIRGLSLFFFRGFLFLIAFNHAILRRFTFNGTTRSYLYNRLLLGNFA